MEVKPCWVPPLNAQYLQISAKKIENESVITLGTRVPSAYPAMYSETQCEAKKGKNIPFSYMIQNLITIESFASTGNNDICTITGVLNYLAYILDKYL